MRKTQTKKSLFRIIESYKHKHAKTILKRWIKKDFIRVVPEEKFCADGVLWFIPDLTCYGENGIEAIYEVVHKSDLSAEKILRMKVFFKVHGWNVKVFKINADYILNQIKKPKRIKAERII